MATSSRLRLSFAHARPGAETWEPRIRAALEEAWRRFEGPDGAVVMVVFLDEHQHRLMHARVSGDDSETDVLAVPYGEDDLFGEILVNLSLAERIGGDEHAADEAALYAVHGALHLLGFDDHEVGDRRRMRAAERAVLGFDADVEWGERFDGRDDDREKNRIGP